MTIISGVLLVSACLCILMLYVLASLLRFDEQGVAEWTAANGIGFFAYILYAFAGKLPPLFAIEVANAVYALANLAALAGFLRFHGRKVPVACFAIVLVVFVMTLALFHYIYESYATRVITFSVFHGTVMAAIAITVFRSKDSRHSRYPYLFTAMAAALLAIVNAVRITVHVIQAGEVTSLLQPASWNIFFIAVAALVLPALTFGAMMMVYDRMLAHTANSSCRDFLTGALTRDAFLERFDHEWQRSRQAGTKLSVLVIDADHLQFIRATYGNAAADQLLTEIALRSERMLRSEDCFSRIGAAQFAALLPKTGHEAAMAFAQRLRARIEKSVLSGVAAPGPGRLSICAVSIGIATLREGESVSDMLARANDALHQARTAGGNRVEYAAPETAAAVQAVRG